MPTLETDQLLAAAVDACDSKKAEDIRILALDVSESALTDYFLICNGTNDRQNVAISDEIEYRLKHDFGVYPNSVEGRRQGEWVLMDYVDFVVHIFLPETRAHYGLERLKKSATQLTLAQLQTEIKARMANLAKSRTKAPAKKATPVKAVAAKKAVPAKKVAAKAPTKTAVKKAVAKKVAAKVPAKKAATKAPAKKSAAKKASSKK